MLKEKIKIFAANDSIGNCKIMIWGGSKSLSFNWESLTIHEYQSALGKRFIAGEITELSGNQANNLISLEIKKRLKYAKHPEVIKLLTQGILAH